MNSSQKFLVLVVIGSALVSACNKPEDTQAPAETAQPATEEAPVASKPNPAAEAKKYFKTKCSVCHGDTGHGDGPGAAALDPKPRAFGDAAWQASITDEAMKKVIVEGGAAVGKSPGMAPNPQLKDQPEVVAELVKIVRSFKK